jgi:hypothetical protein
MWFFFIVVPITIAWIASIVDIFARRDLGGWAKAAWFLAVLILPILGTLIYLVSRPAELAYPGQATGQGYSGYQGGMGTANELETLSRLKTEGALSQEEYEAAKSRILTKAA